MYCNLGWFFFSHQAAFGILVPQSGIKPLSPALEAQSLFLFFTLFIFHWRIIALQYYVGFCRTSTWISHRYTHVPSLLNLSLNPIPSRPLGCHIAPGWAPCVTGQIPTGYLFYIRYYVSMLLSQSIPLSPSLTESTSLFSMSVSLLLLCK